MEECAQRSGIRERWIAFVVSLAPLLACAGTFVACGCTIVPPISGTVVDTITGEPIPGALVRIGYHGWATSFADSIGRNLGKVAKEADSNGRFAVPSKTIVHGPLTWFDSVSVAALHPFYARGVFGSALSIQKADITRKRCRNLTIRLLSLEDYLAPEPDRIGIAGAFGCEDYFVYREGLHLPIGVDQTVSHWRELGDRFPRSKEHIQYEIGRLQRMTGQYTTSPVGR